jgi:hypothetical protein
VVQAVWAGDQLDFLCLHSAELLHNRRTITSQFHTVAAKQNSGLAHGHVVEQILELESQRLMEISGSIACAEAGENEKAITIRRMMSPCVL